MIVLDKNDHVGEGGDALATFWLPDVGGPLRTLFGMAHRHVFAVNRDPKTGWPNPTEGVTERDMHIRCATDPNIVDHQTQPFRMDLMARSTSVSWLPDLWALHRDGTLEIIEVKVDAAGLDKDGYIDKLEAAFAILAQMGWKGRVRYRDWIIGNADRQHNAANLYTDRATHIEPHHKRAFQRLLATEPQLSLGDLVEALDPARPDVAQAVAHRLICMGRVFADLDELLTIDSPVQLRPHATVVSPLRHA